MRQGDSIVGFISGPSVNIWFMKSVHDLFKADADQRFTADWAMVFGPYIHQNRNTLVDAFLETDRDWIFMVDNDMVFTPDDVGYLLDWAEDHGPGVYSAPYLLEDGVLTCGPWDHEVEKVYHPMVALPKEPSRVGVVGAGFTLIHRDVFEAVGKNSFAPIEVNTGEDVSFCWRALEAGYSPWIIPQANPGHFKTFVIYPHDSVRNMIGESVNLVKVNPDDALAPDEVYSL